MIISPIHILHARPPKYAKEREGTHQLDEWVAVLPIPRLLDPQRRLHVLPVQVPVGLIGTSDDLVLHTASHHDLVPHTTRAVHPGRQ
jgi:hypothetical protein